VSAIVIFFSRRYENYVNGVIKNLSIGNTEVAANIIKGLTDADIFQIKPLQSYSKSYKICIEQARADQRRNARPELKKYPDSLDPYETIYLGYPNYWGTMPMVMFTFLEHFNFTGKIIKPFCTNEGSGIGSSVEDIKRLCPGAKVEKPLVILGGNVARSRTAIENWI
jgi:flavodoxin